MKKTVFILIFGLAFFRLTAQKTFVSTFVDSLSRPSLYNPFKIDTILDEPYLIKTSWYNNVIQLESEKKFSEAYKIIVSKKDDDPLAMYLLGKYHYLGLTGTVDKNSAFLWFYNASMRNFSPAFESMGMIYYYGEGYTQSDSAAILSLKKAYKNGIEKAGVKIGYIYQTRKTKSNLDSALYWYQRATTEEKKNILINIASIYESKGMVPEMLAKYEEASKNGLGTSSRRLGEIYNEGLYDVKPDVAKAKAYFEKGCAEDDAQSCNALGVILARSKNFENLYDIFMKGKYLKDRYSIYNMALCLSEGIGIKVDVKQAFELYKEVANTVVEAQNNIGTLYDRNLISGNNHNEAKKWYEKAANSGNVEAMLNLANILAKEGEEAHEKASHWYEKVAATGKLNGIYYYTLFLKNSKEKSEKVIEWAEKLANNANSDESQKKWAWRITGDIYRQRADDFVKKNEQSGAATNATAGKPLNGSWANFQYKKAISAYEKAVSMNDDSAMVKLGQLYYKGNGVAQNLDKALELWKDAAKLGNATAMYNMAYLYEKDEQKFKIEFRYENAIKYYKEAINTAKMNKSLKKDASFRLGNLYQYPIENKFEKKSRDALTWYTIAANLGDTDAMYEIGYIYEYGESDITKMNANKVRTDKEEARKWYKKILDIQPDNEEAREALQRVEKNK